MAALLGCSPAKPRVVLYCSQDQEFAEQLIRDFHTSTGIEVAPHYDTEAEKSVSLYEELVHEVRRPRCDVFWNNEILQTIRLQNQGLLEPYASPAADPFPDSNKAKDHTWTGFAGRARILLVNTQRLPDPATWPRSILDLIKPDWKGKIAMAKPQHGTTATQAVCLFEVLGPEKARQFYLGLRNNDVAVVSGNKQVAVGVGAGDFPMGLTDTDDAIFEVLANHPVAIIYPDRDRPQGDAMGTLFLPNTVALIHGSPNPGGGKQLIDYLLSPDVETKLAQGASHQYPLNPKVKTSLPGPIETPLSVKAMDVNFERAAQRWEEVQEFLRNEFARPF